MASREAFPNGQTCAVRDALTSVAEASSIGYDISFPQGWDTNVGTESRSECTLFAPQPYDVRVDGPGSAAISIDIPPEGDFGPGGSATREEYTVDGVAAVRYDIPPEDGGFNPNPTVVWIIAIAGNLPAEGNDQPYLAISTSSGDPDRMAERTDILDRMVATLDVTE
jgi:hypothetical protein